MRYLVLIQCVFLVSLLLGASASAAPIEGPFQSTDRVHQNTSTYFYIDNAAGEPFEVTVRCLGMEDADEAAFPRLMVRGLNVQERVIFRQQITAPERAGKDGAPSEVTFRMPGQAGVAQVIVSAGKSPQTRFSFSVSPDLPYGIMGSIDVIVPPKGGIERGYIYVPPGAEQLKLEPKNASFTLRDAQGETLLKNESGTVKVDETGTVWRISVEPRQWPGGKVLATGFPVIVCPTEATARRIKASMERLDDGTIVAHKFQVRLDRLLRENLSDPEDFKVPRIDSFEPAMETVLSEPMRYGPLFRGYSPPLPYINLWLDRQVLDADHPFWGAVHMANARTYGKKQLYRVPGAKLNPEKPADALPPSTDEMARQQWNTLSAELFPTVMAFVYGLEPKINPYYHKRALLNRVVLAATRDLVLLLREDELIQDDSGDWPGHISFIFAYSQSGAYGLIGQRVKEVYPGIYREWTEAMKRYADRVAYMAAFNPANQPTHILHGLQRVAEGSGDPAYEHLRRYASRRLIKTMTMPAGYMRESYGPCASYNGITLQLLAYLYRQTKEPMYLEAIRKAQRLFNHTVAIEPGGEVIGASDFNHRVSMPYPASQFGAGRRIMAPYLAESGMWFENGRTIRDQEQSHEKLRAAVREQVKKSPYPISYYEGKLDDSRMMRMAQGTKWIRAYRYYEPTDFKSGEFPFEEEGSFIRNFGDEFIFVKRPSYYTFAYVGKPGIAVNPGELEPMEAGGRTGGGLSLLWTPGYGTAWAAQGWNSFSQHNVVARTRSGNILIPEYDSVEFELDKEASQMVVSGRLNDAPLEYRHTYRFLGDRIEVETRVHATGAFSASEVYLQFPLLASKENGFEVKTGKGRSRLLTLADATGHAVRLRFAQPVSTRAGHTTEKKAGYVDYKIQQRKVELPALWEPGETHTLRYQIIPGSR